MRRRDVALWVLERALFEPYRWGGDDPMAGFDCSGLVIEGLKSAGVLPRSGDWTAASLLELFVRRGSAVMTNAADVEPGALLFWRTPTGRVRHVEMCWQRVGDTVFTIGASGGGSDTVSVAVAERRNAYVKVRPANDGWQAVDPFTGAP